MYQMRVFQVLDNGKFDEIEIVKGETKTEVYEKAIELFGTNRHDLRWELPVWEV